MKNLVWFIELLLLGCGEYEVPGTFEVVVAVRYPAEFSQGGSIVGAEVKVTNIQTGRKYLEMTGMDGKAVFHIRGGNYNIVVSRTEERELVIEGNSVTKNVLFSGTKSGQLVLSGQVSFEMQLGYSVENEGFVLKEMYTSGCRTPVGKIYYADNYVEVYNNTAKVLYSDGLCLGVVHSINTEKPTPWVAAEGNLLDRIPLWSFVAIVPGSGKEHPIQPGESFVIALSGLNHQGDPKGNPNSIDLSHAAWELYVEDGKFVDVPSVPNMLMQRITPRNSTLTFDTQGQVCVIFRLPSDDFQVIFTDQHNYMVEPGGTFTCFMVPYSWIIDGVDNLRLTDQGVYKRLPDMIDVGYIQHRGSGEKVSVRRKVLKVINGRTIYKDTNNSSEDFLTNQDPAPGVIAVQ